MRSPHYHSPPPPAPSTLNNPDATLTLTGTTQSTFTFSPTSLLISAGTLSTHNVSIAAPGGYPGLAFTNNGRLDLGSDKAFASPSPVSHIYANVINAGTINAQDPLTIDPVNKSLYQFSSGSTFTNTGTIQTGSHSSIQVTNSVFNQNAGTLSGNIEFDYGTFIQRRHPHRQTRPPLQLRPQHRHRHQPRLLHLPGRQPPSSPPPR